MPEGELLVDADGYARVDRDGYAARADCPPPGCCDCAMVVRLVPCPPVVANPGTPGGQPQCDEGFRSDVYVCGEAMLASPEGEGGAVTTIGGLGGLIENRLAPGPRTVAVVGVSGCWRLEVGTAGPVPRGSMQPGLALLPAGVIIDNSVGSCAEERCRYGGAYLRAGRACQPGVGLPENGIWVCAARLGAQVCRVVNLEPAEGFAGGCVVFDSATVGGAAPPLPREQLPIGALIVGETVFIKPQTPDVESAPGDCCLCGTINFTGDLQPGDVRCSVGRVEPTADNRLVRALICCCGRVRVRSDGTLEYLDARWELDLYRYEYHSATMDVVGHIERVSDGATVSGDGPGIILSGRLAEAVEIEFVWNITRTDTGQAWTERSRTPLYFDCTLEPFGISDAGPPALGGQVGVAASSDERNCRVRVWRRTINYTAPGGGVYATAQISWNAGMTVDRDEHGPCAHRCDAGSEAQGGSDPAADIDPDGLVLEDLLR